MSAEGLEGDAGGESAEGIGGICAEDVVAGFDVFLAYGHYMRSQIERMFKESDLLLESS